MEIRISSIADKGNLSSERIGFKVLQTCQLKYYIAIKTKKTEGGFRNIGDAFFWFLPQTVNKNDNVVLYTKNGENSIKEGSIMIPSCRLYRRQLLAKFAKESLSNKAFF